ncbi:hypothetical protein ES704_01972 [subsurface metagenome]|jgi:flagellar basal body-associated protein FliL
MTGGQILFFAIISLSVLAAVATIINSWWIGRKERQTMRKR